MSDQAGSKGACDGDTISRPPADEAFGGEIGLIYLQPTASQSRIALAVVVLVFFMVATVAPFASVALPMFAAFIPFLNATILVTDLITAILLFAQFSISRSRALLVLAGGYLFTALIVIPHALTFPGAFSPTGFLGAGIQTTAWLYIFWHFGFPAALSAYALLKDNPSGIRGSIRSAIGRCVAITVAIVLVLTGIAIAADPYLPRLFSSATGLTTLGTFIPSVDLLFCVLSLVLMWVHRRSILDLWLMVVLCAMIGELALTVVRFSLGFYVSRMLSIATSTIVLVILLAETTGLYTRLARANAMLRRERDNKLMNLEAAVASISHEVKQPLAAIVMRGSTALRFLGYTPPDVEKARSALNKIVIEGRRASEIFDNIRDLFRKSNHQRTTIDMNKLISSIVESLHVELADHRIEVQTELQPELPPVWGHRGQLQDVLLNLIRNATEAMEAGQGKFRVLRLTSERRPNDGIGIKVTDTGPGIDPERLDTIFDAFVTTKSQGMGLGLAICRMIVERHGGQLLASSGEGGGAQFEILLPIEPRPDAAAN
ncbi:putative Sensor protein [Bradyrhizobium sp. STM 3843]|uniref:ATP-binding protein n=1 Tax=Bradyrhizobium sp. STM 3843 TaxID=551947 RepID=UPI000240AFCD|nr:ATP-binding protein [Bradyrhizobium sp. STM 3843]CCE06420.1 putative Sensor protein [Bradyrhizobium sp. STM 3843]